MDATTLLLIIVPSIFFLVLALSVVVLLARRNGLMTTFEGDGVGAGEVRPWWGSPLVWLALCGVSAFLGLVFAPHLFGGVFLFLPFLWLGKPRRRGERRR